MLNLAALCVREFEGENLGRELIMALGYVGDGKGQLHQIEKEDNRYKGKRSTGQDLGTDWKVKHQVRLQFSRWGDQEYSDVISKI